MKIKTIDVQAKEWIDKVYGNSYFAAVVTINYGMKTEKQIKIPFQYGYGDAYRYRAFEVLKEQGLVPEDAVSYSDLGIIARYSKQEKCLKRDVITWGKE